MRERDGITTPRQFGCNFVIKNDDMNLIEKPLLDIKVIQGIRQTYVYS